MAHTTIAPLSTTDQTRPVYPAGGPPGLPGGKEATWTRTNAIAGDHFTHNSFLATNGSERGTKLTFRIDKSGCDVYKSGTISTEAVKSNPRIIRSLGIVISNNWGRLNSGQSRCRKLWVRIQELSHKMSNVPRSDKMRCNYMSRSNTISYGWECRDIQSNGIACQQLFQYSL